ncbi:putative Ig domain-containing protein [Streptacidiphilus sp. MAP5-3]|uniref:putative Ig domain-containing protein n=1 Tax=unclassified Streptacidiphilus TaxID=2643834 RepID=UPI003515C6A7
MRTPRIARRTSALGRTVAASVTAVTVGFFGLAAITPAQAATAAPAASASSSVTIHRQCPQEPVGYSSCLALKRTDVHPQASHANASPLATVSGYGPTDLRSAYNLASAAASKGSGETVALIDAFDYPSAQSDLDIYRSQYGLPACDSGCFTKLNQNGQASPLPSPAPSSDDWTGEEALDIDMVSAICPNCHIDLVEANSDSNDDLGAAVNAAVNAGAKFVSNSYGGSESSTDSTYDTEYYDHPGVAVTVSSGDSGYGVEYPAASQYVTAVGGTSLSTASNSRGWTESVWSTSSTEGAGSGCSADDPKPSWQTDTGCSKRTVADVSAVADPATGVAVYDTYNNNGGWNVYGGTSVASPIIASVYALAGNPGASDYPAKYPYQHTSSLNDVTTGSTASCSPAYLCTAEAGYDGPTGWGTPNGTAAFQSGSSTGNTVSVTNPGSQTSTVGTAASLQISGSDSGGASLSYSATGLPAGLSISSSGLISGTPTTAGTFNVTVTATDSTGASGTTSFSWTVSSTTGGGGCANPGQKLGNPGFETGAATPWTMTAGVLNNDTVSEPAHSGNWDAWLDGYGAAHTDTLAQTVAVPSGCSAAFSFWLHVDTGKTSTTAVDTLKVQALNSSGTVLSTLGTYSNLNASSGYNQYSFNLTSYAGQTVTLKFTGVEKSGAQTSFVVDDTALNAS